MNPHNWNLAKFPNHRFVLKGIFNRPLYNKLIVQNLVENPHKGQMKSAHGVGSKISKNNRICCTTIRQVRLPLYLYENLRHENCTIISWINRKDNSYGSQEILLCLKIGLPTNHPTFLLVKTVLIYGVQVVGKQTSVVGMINHARIQK